MKKLIFTLITILSLSAAQVNAQTYSQNKLKYDYHMYFPQYDDPYNPFVSGLCSFFVPGLGQMICGETGRGLAFMGGSAGCMLVGMVGYGVMVSSLYDTMYLPGYYTSPLNRGVGTGLGMMVLGFTAMTAVNIWSIVDAVHVAQVNNMYFQDLRKSSSINLELAPYLSQITVDNRIVTPVGLSLRVSF